MNHEDLLGYLLGALEPDEMRRVAGWLREDAAARAELDKIERALRPLRHDDRLQGDSDRPRNAEELPPPDLISRTLDSLPPLAGSTGSVGPIDAGVSPGGATDPVLVSLNAPIDAPADGRQTWFDWAGGAVSMAILLGLLLPMLANGRFEARKVACQEHLRQLGTALTSFVNRSQQNRLPAVADEGPEAFAGVYAVRLNQVGLLPDPELRWCPSRDMPEPAALASMNFRDVADAASLHRIAVDRLKRIQRYSGGHYAYSLGVIDTNGFTSPRFSSRSTFAVMSDAPKKQSSEAVWTNDPVGHGGTGINVLYEDGRVRFVAIPSLDAMMDHPLRNHLGHGEAGVNVDDASLAPSSCPPFVYVRQR